MRLPDLQDTFRAIDSIITAIDEGRAHHINQHRVRHALHCARALLRYHAPPPKTGKNRKRKGDPPR